MPPRRALFTRAPFRSVGPGDLLPRIPPKQQGEGEVLIQDGTLRIKKGMPEHPFFIAVASALTLLGAVLFGFFISDVSFSFCGWVGQLDFRLGSFHFCADLFDFRFG